MELARAEAVEGRRAVDGLQVCSGLVRSDPGRVTVQGSSVRSNGQRSMLESREEGAQESGQRVKVGLSTSRLEAEPQAQIAQEGLAPRRSRVEPHH